MTRVFANEIDKILKLSTYTYYFYNIVMYYNDNMIIRRVDV